MALSFLLARWAKSQRKKITGITIDHGLRPESSEEAKKVSQWVKNIGIPRHEIKMINLSADTLRKGRQLSTAREKRFEALEGLCHQMRIDEIFLGHHFGDQLETFLLRFFRSSGNDGLTGIVQGRIMSGTSKLQVLRPFLNIPKSRLIATCNANNIPYVLDPTNENDEFVRNRLRKLTPEMLRHVSAIEFASFFAAQTKMRKDIALLVDEYIAREAIIDFTFGMCELRTETLYNTPPALLHRVLNRISGFVGGRDYPIPTAQLEQFLPLLRKEKKFTYAGCMWLPFPSSTLTPGEDVPYAPGRYRQVPEKRKHEQRRARSPPYYLVTNEVGDVHAAQPVKLPFNEPILWRNRFMIKVTKALGRDLYVQPLDQLMFAKIPRARKSYYSSLNLPLDVVCGQPVIVDEDKQFIAAPTLKMWRDQEFNIKVEFVPRHFPFAFTSKEEENIVFST